MDNTAIETIAKLAMNQFTATDRFVLTFDGQKMQSTEQFCDTPWRFRGAFTTYSANDFVAYLTEHADEATHVFINPSQGEAKAILDMGNAVEPEWGRHTAQLTLVQRPEYQHVLKWAGQAMGQQEFIDFVEDFPECFRFIHADGETMDMGKLVACLRRLKIDTAISSETDVKPFGQTQSVAELVEIKASGSDALPSGFYYTAVPHDHFTQYSLFCRLRAVPGDKAAQLKYRLTGLDALQQKIADELHKKIESGLQDTPARIYKGEMAYQAGR